MVGVGSRYTLESVGSEDQNERGSPESALFYLVSQSLSPIWEPPYKAVAPPKALWWGSSLERGMLSR
jgi:hypothetical protein